MSLNRVLLFGLPALAVVAVVIFTSDGSDSGFQAEAARVCEESRHELEGLPQSPIGVSQALAMEHEALAISERGLSRLEALVPRASAEFNAGVTADRALMREFHLMLDRPDFVRLSLTLPDHPDAVPAWMKEWLARSQALQAEARARFGAAGVPACEKAFV